MNYSLIALALLFSTTFLHAKEQRELDKYVPSYILISDTLKPELENDFEVHFIIKGLEGNDQVHLDYSFNEQEYAIQLNKSFEFSERLNAGLYQCKFYFSQEFNEIITDSINFEAGHLYIYQLTFDLSEMLYIVDKPVIYLYPDEETAVNVQVLSKDQITFTYPLYENGWNIIADPNGDIKLNNETYNYLFWEGTHKTNLDSKFFEEGFVVEGKNITEFLENELDFLGFTSKERADFITFWAPRMMGNAFNFIKFMFNEECNQIAELKIEPHPDNLNRIYMSWCPLNAPLQTNAQKLTTFNRKGFDILEWGGEQITPPTTVDFNLIN